MKTFNSINSYKTSKKSIVTIGTFDGVHIGHNHILQKLVYDAKNSESESLVLTFFPHPRMILQENNEVKLLNTITEKSKLLENIGIDNLIIHPFDKEFSRLTAEDFVKTILVEKFNIQKIIIGYDHRFGRNRTATIDDLIIFGKQYGFEVEQISAQQIDEISVSSTKIRTAILDGNITLANNYLGYNYSFSGTVVKGKQLGRTIGFPTANINIDEEYKLIPKNGVYIVKSLISGNNFYGMMNIGTRPTVNGLNQTIEVFFIDFDSNLYDQKITIEILDFIRDEQKFDSLESLKKQIEIDKQTTLKFYKKQNF
ncbi:bifunctional riboflavin kinase/FAD synthetase [Flavobacterium sp.]|uniref:bifunctional riboflavin kinase/FAD synthetase n=1 Tax=Flavobacterium sp. TaxID=239 RepID=UPI00261283A9|nr:bifunctional riboflavin kinase/FAD synthetase [Flavobacterium sp.]